MENKTHTRPPVVACEKPTFNYWQGYLKKERNRIIKKIGYINNETI